MNYVQDAIDAVKANYQGEYDLDDEFAEVYGLLLILMGPFANLKDVHDAWGIVRNRTRPDHVSLVPFDQLSPAVQELDRPFLDAIHAGAKTLLDGGWPGPLRQAA